MNTESKRLQRAVAILVGSMVVLAAHDAMALRCGTQVVAVGDFTAEVVSACGEPDHVEVWQEERIFRDFSTYRSDAYGEDLHRNREPFLVKQQVIVERWTYNFGNTRLIRYLRFENGRLVDIEVGDHGYSP